MNTEALSTSFAIAAIGFAVFMMAVIPAARIILERAPMIVAALQ